jgi:hypothetical protein
MFQHCLGTALQSRFELTGSPADLDEAGGAFRGAVESVGEHHPLRPIYLTALSQTTGEHARRQGNASGLEEAIRLATLALELSPLDHPDRTHPLLTLADHLTDRATLAGRPEDAERALSLRREAATTATAPAPLRMRAAWPGPMPRTAPRGGEALHGYATAVSLLPVIAWQARPTIRGLWQPGVRSSPGRGMRGRRGTP